MWGVVAAKTLLNTQTGLGVKLLPPRNRPEGKEVLPHWHGPVGLHLGLLIGTVVLLASAFYRQEPGPPSSIG